MWVAAEYAARCVVLQAGRVVADARTRTVFAQPERLEPLSLRVPQIPRFTQHYGRTPLTPEELASCFRVGWWDSFPIGKPEPCSPDLMPRRSTWSSLRSS